jgi:hypothetical protein
MVIIGLSGVGVATGLAALISSHTATVVFITGAGACILAGIAALAVMVSGDLGAQSARAELARATLSPCANAECNDQVCYYAPQDKYLHLNGRDTCSLSATPTPIVAV